MNRRKFFGAAVAAPIAAKGAAAQMATIGGPIRSIGLEAPGPWNAMSEKGCEAMSDPFYVAKRIKSLKSLIAGEGEDFEAWQQSMREGSVDWGFVNIETLRSVSAVSKRRMVQRLSFERYLERNRKSWLQELKGLLG